MKCRLRDFSLIHLVLLYFILLLQDKRYFTAKIIHMYIISMRLACMYMYAGAYFGPSRTSTVKLLCENHKKSFIVIVQMVSKYASG